MELSLSLTNPPRRIRIEVSKDVSASTLFEAASKATNIPKSGLKLIFRGRIIANRESDKTVAEEFKVEDGCVIHCMGKPVANMTSATTTGNAPQISSSSTTVSSGSTVIPPSAAAVASVSTTTTESTSTLSAALLKIKNSHPASDYITALNTMEKLLLNVTTKPTEEKYRKVKKSNAAFVKRLGRLNGSVDAMTAIGFATNSSDEYVLTPSPEAWPKLLESKATLDRAIADHKAQQAQNAANLANASQPSTDMGFGAMPPNMGMPNMAGMGGMPPMPPGMDPSVMANMLRDPQALSRMLQNPTVQNMMQNHPQLANNPMMQEQMRQLANNPQMVQQLSRMMNDPDMMSRMQNMMQQQGVNGMGMGGAASSAGSGGANSNAGTAAPSMDLNSQMEMMRQFTSSMGANNTNAQQPQANQQQPQNQSNQNQSSANSGNESAMTEEEMIAAAIARSLREQ